MFNEDKLTDQIIMEMREDDRKGVQALLKRVDLKQEKIRKLKQQFAVMSEFEQDCWQDGYTNIAGVDEVGRGPLAGPVVAAAVILPQDFTLLGLNDSKQLNEATRESYYEIIKKNAIGYGVGIIHNDEIDKVNIYQATKLAMLEAIEQIKPRPDFVLVDAMPLEEVDCPTKSIIKGDSRSISIAAASILAKVTRDRYMKELDLKYPNFHFASNMGYGTKQHLEALKNEGPTPFHRRSFAPVSN
ncbi:ribonuclease HII [Oceanobacillus kapialis]